RLPRSVVVADADAKRNEPRFFLRSVSARVRQNLRAGAPSTSQRGRRRSNRGFEKGAGAGLANRKSRGTSRARTPAQHEPQISRRALPSGVNPGQNSFPARRSGAGPLIPQIS